MSLYRQRKDFVTATSLAARTSSRSRSTVSRGGCQLPTRVFKGIDSLSSSPGLSNSGIMAESVNPDLTGPGSHGTAVAGVAAATGNNSLGVSGACQNCKVLPLRVFDATSSASDTAFANAITYATAFADVLNNGWLGRGNSLGRHHHCDSRGGCQRPRQPAELYSLTDHPTEQINRIADRPDLAAELFDQLLEIRSREITIRDQIGFPDSEKSSAHPERT